MGSGQRPLFNTQVVDALSYQGILIDKMADGLTDEEVQEEEYEQEYKESSLGSLGRSAITGY